MKKSLSTILALSMVLSLFFSASAVTKMYAPDGRTANVNDYDVQSWKNVGWYDYPVAVMYAPDGRTTVISKNAVQSWKNVGWYDYPVVTMYAPDGRTAVISKNAVQSWKNVGWYDYPVATVYAPDGRTAVISKNAVESWKNAGWYDYPVITVYAPDGRNAVIARSALQSWKNVGWSETPQSQQQTSTQNEQTAYANQLTWSGPEELWAVIDLRHGPYNNWQQNRTYYIKKYFSSMSDQEIANIKNYAENSSIYYPHTYLIIPRYKTTNMIKKVYVDFGVPGYYVEGEQVCNVSQGIPFSVQVEDPAGDINPILKIKNSQGREYIIGQNFSDMIGIELSDSLILDLTEWRYSY